MQEQELACAKRLSDDALVAKLMCCVREDREVTARLLIQLGEVDARGLFRDLGYSSMFDYAVQALHMSESEAWLRIRAARFAREFPAALGMVARGELHMTALKLLAPVLTPSNLELLDKARFKSKLEIQTLIATHFPLPDVQSTIRKLPTPKSPSPTAQVQLPSNAKPLCPAAEGAQSSHDTRLASTCTEPDPSSNTGIRAGGGATAAGAEFATPTPSEHATRSGIASVERDALSAAPVRGTQVVTSGGPSLGRAPVASSLVPLSKGRYKVQFTASQSLADKFNEAADLLRNQLPNGELAIIVERALDLLIAERKKQRFAQTSKPRMPPLAAADSEPTAGKAVPATPTTWAEPPAPKPNTRHISQALRRQVYERDAGRCCFVSPDGRQCGARGNLEFHHITAFARGGEATLDNICLICRAHNALAAERDYGRDYVQRCISDRRAAPSGPSQEGSLFREGTERLEGPKALRSRTPVSTPTIGLGPDPS
jgi:hypothetical protein